MHGRPKYFYSMSVCKTVAVHSPACAGLVLPDGQSLPLLAAALATGEGGKMVGAGLFLQNYL